MVPSGMQYRTAISPEQVATGFVALLFTLAVLFMSWELFGGNQHTDFRVYLETFQPGSLSKWEMYAPDSIAEVFTREVVWDEFVRLLVRIIGDPFLVLKAISAFILWINAYLLYRRYGFLLPTVLLLNPLFLTFALSQLRLAFAIAVLLVALSIRFRAISWVLALAAVFVHSAIPIFIGLFLVVKYVERHGDAWPFRRLLMVAGGTCLVLILVLGFGREGLLLALGDRRAAVYAGSKGSSTLMYVAFWIGVLAMQVMAGREYLKKPDNLYAAMNLVLFVGLTVVGTYGSRFAAAAFPIIVASVLNLPSENRNIVLPMLLCFQAVQLLYWFELVY